MLKGLTEGMIPIASRQWSTGTLLDGLSCLNQNDPAALLAAGDMSAADALTREQQMQASCSTIRSLPSSPAHSGNSGQVRQGPSFEEIPWKGDWAREQVELQPW